VKNYNILSTKPSCVWVYTNFIGTRIDSSYYRSESLEDLKVVLDYSCCCKISEFFEVSKLAGFEYTKYFTQENLAKGTVIALTSQNILENNIDFSNVIKIPVDIHNVLNRSKVMSKDILLSYTGQYRRACVVPDNLDLHLGPNICRLRKKKEINEYYVSTFLNSKYGQSILDREKTVSAQPTVNMSRIRDITIPIPSPEIQKYIGDKVRRAEELREEAKRLKEEAESLISNSINLERLVEKVRDYKSMNNWVDSASISGRIDGQYYINPITEINKYMKNIDMKLVVLRDIAEVRKGFAYSNESSNGVPYIRISDLDDLLIDYSKVVRIDNKTYQQKRNSQLKYFDLIMAITGATIGKVSVFYNKEIEKATLSADTAYVRFNNIEDSIAYLLYFKTVIGQLAITQGITGATNKHLAIEDIKNIVLPQFEDSIKKEVKNKIVQSMDNIYTSKLLIQQAKQDVEDLIEGNFDMSKLDNDSSTESRC
jgi:type I restriction enzyme S subunit